MTGFSFDHLLNFFGSCFQNRDFLLEKIVKLTGTPSEVNQSKRTFPPNPIHETREQVISEQSELQSQNQPANGSKKKTTRKRKAKSTDCKEVIGDDSTEIGDEG